MVRLYSICVGYITLLYSFGNAKLFRMSHPIPLRYLDGHKKDLFFDRIIFLSVHVHNFTGDGENIKHVSIGVLIDNNRVLTSYNALRSLTTDGKYLERLFACYLRSRTVKPNNRIEYHVEGGNIICGRPVVPMKDNELSDEEWHGPDKKHSPVHDLMVLRLEDSLNVWEPEIEEPYEIRHSPEHINSNTSQRAGPLITNLITPEEEFRKRIQFVSLGLRWLRSYKYLEMFEYEDSEDPIVNCDTWLPRNWGYFICLKNNEDQLFGFSSGTMLFSERRLFGVGSFTLWRGKESILVFTDIRPYLEHIKHTCSDHDLV